MWALDGCSTCKHICSLTLRSDYFAQGHFLRGPPYEAITTAAQGIYDCALRCVHEARGRSEVEHARFSTPQGEEVYQWLSSVRLLQFAPILARNKLDSLRKVSHLTQDEIVKINEELYASHKNDDGLAQHGSRISLGDAIETLKADPRTRTLKERSYGYTVALLVCGCVFRPLDKPRSAYTLPSGLGRLCRLTPPPMCRTHMCLFSTC